MGARLVRLAAAAASLVLAAACGGGSSSSPAARDAAPESAAVADAGSDSGDCFPFCSSGGDAGGGTGTDASGDGASSCDQLKAVYETLQGPAQSCDPQLPGQCSATTNGPCCPLTVTATNGSAVDNFDQAVAAYLAQCNPDCSMMICQPAPSDQCDPLGASAAQGRCR
jgi:hypothetical protein